MPHTQKKTALDSEKLFTGSSGVQNDTKTDTTLLLALIPGSYLDPTLVFKAVSMCSEQVAPVGVSYTMTNVA